MGDLSTAACSLFGEGASGVNALGSGAVPLAQADFLAAYKSAYRIYSTLTGPEYLRFKNWAKNENIIMLASKSSTRQHGMLREGTQYLKNIVYQRCKGSMRILVLDSTYKLAREVAKELPHAAVRFAVRFGEARDEHRFKTSLVDAKAELDKSLDPLAKDFQNFARGGSSSFFTKYRLLEEIPAYEYDYVFCFDGLLDYHPSEVQRLIKRTNAASLLTTMHYCPELFLIKGKTIHNQFFGYKWFEQDHRYVMDMNDGSFLYAHKKSNCKAWWNSNVVGSLFIDPIFARGGYGLFSIGGLEPGIAVPRMTITSLEEVVRLFKLVPFFDLGKFEAIICMKKKYEAMLKYVEQIFSEGGPINWGKIMLFARSHEGKTSTVGKLLISEWDLYEEDLMDIIAFAIFEFSAKKARIQSLFPKIMKFLDAGGRHSLFDRCFRFPWRRFVESVLEYIYGPKTIELIDGYKVISTNVSILQMDAVRELKTSFETFEYEYLDHVAVGGKKTEAALEAFKKEVLHYSKYCGEKLPHGALKLGSFQHLLRDRDVIHLGAEPGWMVPELARLTSTLLVASLKCHLVPKFIRGPKRDTLLWTELTGTITEFNKDTIVVDPRVTYEHDMDLPDLLKKKLRPGHLIFSDISCCNGKHCTVTDRAECENPIAWVRYWLEFTKETGNEVIFKVNTPQLERVWRTMAGWHSVKITILDQVNGVNPMSFEKYVHLKSAFFARGLTRDHFYRKFQTTLANWRAFKVYKKSWVAPMEADEVDKPIPSRASPPMPRGRAVATAVESDSEGGETEDLGTETEDPMCTDDEEWDELLKELNATVAEADTFFATLDQCEEEATDPQTASRLAFVNAFVNPVVIPPKQQGMYDSTDEGYQEELNRPEIPPPGTKKRPAPEPVSDEEEADLRTNRRSQLPRGALLRMEEEEGPHLVNPLALARQEAEPRITLDIVEKEVKPVLTYGIKNPAFKMSEWTESPVYKQFGKSMLCEILADGLCFYRSVAALMLGAQEGYEVAYKRFVFPILKGRIDQITPCVSLVEVKYWCKQVGMPYHCFADKDFYLGTAETRARSFGAMLLWVDHADVALQVRVKNRSFTKVHPYVRPFVPMDWSKVKYVTVNLQKYTKKTMKDVCKIQAAAFESDPKDPFHELHVKAVKQAKKESIMSLETRDIELFVVQGVPGGCKTETALDLIRQQKLKKPHSVLYIAASNLGRTELMQRYCEKFGLEFTDDQKNLGFFVKTFVAATVTSSKEGFVVPSPAIEFVIIDEGFTSSVMYMQYIMNLFSKAKLVIIGDTQQMVLDPNKVWTETTDTSRYMVDKMVEAFGVFKQPDYHGWHNLSVSRRFGPRAVHLAKKVKPEVNLFCDNLKPFFVEKLAADQLEKVKKAGMIVMVASRTEYEQADSANGIHTVRTCQGLSQPITAINVDAITANTLKVHPSTAYVALTRAQNKLILIRADPMTWNRHGIENMASLASFETKISSILGHIGGEWRRLPKFNFEGMDNDWLAEIAGDGPTVAQPTVKKHSVYPKRHPVEHFPFSVVDIQIFQQLENGNLLEHMNSDPQEIGEVNVVVNKIIGKTVKAQLITETMHGNRNYVSSIFQNLATVIHRNGVAKVVRNKFKVWHGYDFGVIREQFVNTFLDMEKYNAIMSTSVYEYVSSSALNDFCEVMKLNPIEAETTMRQFMWTATEHLKTQIKAKDVESTLKHKNGQPIVACSKSVNIVYSPIFRVCKKLFLMCLNKKIIWSSGLTPEEIAKAWSKDNHDPAWIMMNDYPEYDASQVKETHDSELVIWQIFNPAGKLLDHYFKYINRVFVIGESLSYLALGQRLSGTPDTFDGNTMKQLIDFLISGYKGPLKEKWFEMIIRMIFGGDDSGVSLKCHPSRVFDFEWLSKILYGPMKMVIVKHGVLEFSNWLILNGETVYNPLVAVKKILNKNYTEVLATPEKWYEWMDSFNTLLWNVRDHFWACVYMTSIWHEWSLEFSEYILRSLESFACMTWSRAKKTLAPQEVVLEDFVVGGGAFEKTTENSSLHNSILTMADNNSVNRLLELVQHDKQITNPSFSFSTSGPSHCPSFACAVSIVYHGTKLVAGGSAATKVDAKKAACEELYKIIKVRKSTSKARAQSKVVNEAPQDVKIATQDSNDEAFVNAFMKQCSETSFPEAMANNRQQLDRKVWTTSALSMFYRSLGPQNFQLLMKCLLGQAEWYTFVEWQKSGSTIWKCCNCGVFNLKDSTHSNLCFGCDTDVSLHIAFDNEPFGEEKVWTFGEVAVTDGMRLPQREKKAPKVRGAGPKKLEKKILKEVKQLEKKVHKKPRRQRRSTESARLKNGESALKGQLRREMRGWLPEEKLVLKGFADPKNNPPVRYNAPLHDVPTSVDNVFEQFKVPWSVAGGTNLPYTDQMIMRFASPTLSTIFYDPNPANADWEYQVWAQDASANLSATDVSTTFERHLLGNVPETLKYSFQKNAGTSGFAPHGDIIPGYYFGDDEMTFCWIQEGQSFDLDMGDVDAATGGTLMVYRYDGVESLLFLELQGTPAADHIVITFTATENGYFGFKFALDVDSVITVTCSCYRSGGTNNGIWRHTMMKETEALARLAAAIGMHGVDILFTNTSQLLNQAGSCVTVQIPSTEHWSTFMFNDGVTHYDEIASKKRAYATKLKEGAHIWRKPIAKTDLTLKNYAKVNAVGNLVDLRASLVPDTDYIICYASGPASATNLGRMTLANSFEFQTASQLFSQEVAKMPYQIYDNAVDKLKHVQQSHTNSKHESALAKGVNTALTIGEALLPLIA